jgi:hypothetical protein
MAYKQRGFPMHAGISPMRQSEQSSAKDIAETLIEKNNNAAETEANNVNTVASDNLQKSIEQKRQDLAATVNDAAKKITSSDFGKISTPEEKAKKEAERKVLKNGEEEEMSAETKKQALRDAWRNTGGGHIYAAGESIVKGIKNIRAKRKARKAGELTDAQAAVTGGTANLKQTKLVDKTNNRTHEKLVKTEKANIKDAEKLKQYNIDKKNKAAGISKRQAEKNKATQDAASGELYKVGK